MKTKKEIIEETAAFYNRNNLGMSSDGGCIYLNEETGNKCALGRCMTEKGIALWGDYADNADSLSHTIFRSIKENHQYTRENVLDSILKEEYQGHEIGFWQNLQALHDNSGLWDADGLNSIGESARSALINTYS